MPMSAKMPRVEEVLVAAELVILVEPLRFLCVSGDEKRPSDFAPDPQTQADVRLVPWSGLDHNIKVVQT
jgi:hypothetical protein